MEKFTTKMTVDKDRRIIALSDIHADIHAFIIALRDCAKVIRKKDGFNFEQNKIDEDLEINLNKNIWDTTYMLDLNYEWCGGDTIVVITGDIIDGKRHATATKTIDNNGNDIGDEALYYPHIEIKLLYFITYINFNSFNTGNKNYGRIIKLLGNHEVGNFTDIFNDMYLFDKDKIDQNYINLAEMAKEGDTTAIDSLKKNQIYESRQNIFKIDKTNDKYDFGFALYLLITGTGILLKINNNVFVHGMLVKDMTFEDYNNINNIINSYTPDIKKKEEILGCFNKLNKIDSPLWMREWGNLDNRIINSKQFCDSVDKNIEKFCSTLPNCKSSEIRVIIGHCIQYVSTFDNTINSSFSNLVHGDNIIEIFSNASIYTGKPTKDVIFGISSECYKNNIPKIIKIDIGMSRSFDNINEMNKIITNSKELLNKEASYFNGRTPQVIEIIGDELRIIRSSMKNTSIHLARPSYKMKMHYIENNNNKRIKELTEYNNMIKGSLYYNKYIKYKMKYITLATNKNKE